MALASGFAIAGWSAARRLLGRGGNSRIGRSVRDGAAVVDHPGVIGALAARPWRPPGRRRDLTPYEVGLLVTVIGFVVMTPDGLLIRLVDVDPWTLVFWRCVLVACGLGAFIALRAGRETPRRFIAIGRTGVVVALFSAAGNLTFVLSMTHTDVANTLVIISASPFLAALMSRVALGERVPRRTWVAITVVLGGTGLIFAGSVGKESPTGILLAVGSALAIAASTTAIRRGRTVSMIPAVVLGNLIAASVAAIFVRSWVPAPRDMGLLAVMGLGVLPAAVGLVTVGPRYLPAPEVNLLSLIETVLGPLWVWWALAEVPTVQALVAGSVIVPTLVAHSFLARRAAAGPAAG